MNENLNIVEILKDYLKGTKLYSTIFREVKLYKFDKHNNKIWVEDKKCGLSSITPDGKFSEEFDGECTIFPSRNQRDWSKFNIKKVKFDPKTLQPFDRVLVFDNIDKVWSCDFYSHKVNEQECFNPEFPYICVGNSTDRIIPYNDDTKHLVETNEEAPEFYRYWED